MKTKCDLCKHSKYPLSIWFIIFCLMCPPIGIPTLLWILYKKIFKIECYCYNKNVNWWLVKNNGKDCIHWKD